MAAVFDAKDIAHIARLARLKVEEVELGKVGQELSRILSYVAKLQECETTAVEPTAQVGGLENVWRDDAVSSVPSHDPQLLREAFPKKKRGFLEVEAVFE